MTITDAIQEFGFDCKIRKLSPKTISNYQKQLKYLQRYLNSEFKITEIEDIKSIHIKQFLALKDDQKCKARYIKEGDNPVFSEDDFSDCPNLKIAIIPNSVTSLPEKAFEKSRFLKIITPSGSYATYNEYASLYNSMYPD